MKLKKLRAGLFSVLMVLALTWPASGMGDAVFAAGKTHYIAVASDRHENEDAIYNAMHGMPESVEYVCLNGDMVSFASSKKLSATEADQLEASGKEKSQSQDPYNTSTVLGEVQSVFENLDNTHVDIVYGSHDSNATDDANIMACADTSKMPSSADKNEISQNQSGCIFVASDKSYYVYGISYYDMMAAATAKEEAEKFIDWVKGIDASVPVIAISHVPLHYLRKDNLGATYWDEALRYAATGSTTGTEIKREVVFLHGHNHTNEKVEYFMEPGQTITLQGTSASESKDETLTYTYITAGYLNEFTTATLVEITDGHLAFTKYTEGKPSALAYYDVTFESNGGSDVETQRVFNGDTVTFPGAPARSGYVFDGWFKDSTLKTAWDFDHDTVTADTTLYAGWSPLLTASSTITSDGNTYKIIKAASSSAAGKVRLTKAKNTKSVTVPAAIKTSDGKKYKVTSIAAKSFTGSKIRKVTIGKNVSVIKANAFKNSKATTIILKTKLLKKSKVKNALKGSKVKTVKVRLGSKKLNKKYVKKYKKIFTKKIVGRKVTVKR